MPVRTFLIGAGSCAASSTAQVITVPVAHTLLLKSVQLQGGASTNNTVVSVIATSAAGRGCVVSRATLAANASFHSQVFIAVDPGGRLEVTNAGPGTINYWLSGALLPGAVPPLAGTLPA